MRKISDIIYFMIKKTIKRFFLNFIFNKFNTYPKYLSTFMPTEFEIKKIDIPLIKKFLLKFYKNEKEEIYQNNTSFSLVFNKDIFIVAYDNKIVFLNYNLDLKFLTNYELKYSISKILKINDTTILSWGQRNIKFCNRNYFITFNYTTLIDISDINNITILNEFEDSKRNITTIVKINSNLFAASINRSVVLFEINNTTNMNILSRYNTKHVQKELTVINNNELLCNEDLLRLDISNPKEIKLIEVEYGMAYIENIIKIDEKRIFYHEYYERGGNYFVIDELPSYKNISRYSINYSFKSLILFDTNTIALITDKLILLDISNEKNICIIAEINLEKYKTKEYIDKEAYIIKINSNTIYYISKTYVVVFKILENYAIEEVKSYDFLNLHF